MEGLGEVALDLKMIGSDAHSLASSTEARASWTRGVGQPLQLQTHAISLGHAARLCMSCTDKRDKAC